jgi:Zn-dependent M32 family carboxypeptidase
MVMFINDVTLLFKVLREKLTRIVNAVKQMADKVKDTDVIRESYDRNTNQEPLTNNKETNYRVCQTFRRQSSSLE